jgi:hypothetical protein
MWCFGEGGVWWIVEARIGMTLDIRIPIGLLFIAIGALIFGYGVLGDAPSKAIGMNIDTPWGAVLLAFGVSMLGLAWRYRRRLG